MAKKPLIQHASLSEKIYDVLKDRIINEELRPGERLLDDRLASSFGVSRTPVREALARLSNEGLVEIVSRSGAYVRKLTREDIEEIYEIRRVLEGLAAKKAATFIPDREIKQLSALLEKAKGPGKESFKAYMDFDVKLHDSILKNCHNQRLTSIMANLYTLIHVFRVRMTKNKKKAEQALKEHEAVLEAIRARDAKKAEKITMEHIERSKDSIELANS